MLARFNVTLFLGFPVSNVIIAIIGKERRVKNLVHEQNV